MELEFQNATIGLQKFFFFKLDSEKIEFQKLDIFLINLGNEAKYCFFLPKKGIRQFCPSKNFKRTLPIYLPV